MHKFRFTIYINGESSRSQLAITNLKSICDQAVPDNYQLTVIDLQTHPDLLVEKNIIVSPTIDREEPPPERRIVGDLSDRDQVRGLLGV